ncbi:MAG TPA: FCD domain-containing protein [Streptosporangiaceae bacterium]|nr:FCD domain-containing protein [Streptosporangiaceae bacterium]
MPRLTVGQAAPIVQLKTYELVAQRLLNDIANGVLQPGAVVPGEIELAETLQVGRSSVREALRVLDSRGLIARAGTGRFMVAEHANPVAEALSVMYDLRRIDLEEIFDLRALIEIQAAGVAAERRTPEDLTKIAEPIGAMQWGSATPEELHQADMRFHIAVAAATQNRATARIVEALRLIVYSAVHGPLFTRTDSSDWSSATIGEHVRIVEAISAGDATAARTAMRAHLDRTAKQSLDVLARVARETANTPAR